MWEDRPVGLHVSLDLKFTVFELQVLKYILSYLILTSEDTPTANCGTSGANDYIEIVNSRASSAGDP